MKRNQRLKSANFKASEAICNNCCMQDKANLFYGKWFCIMLGYYFDDDGNGMMMPEDEEMTSPATECPYHLEHVISQEK